MADIQKTLVLVKPDGVKKHICGEVISRFERKGLSIHAIKMINVPVELAEEHYAEHKGKGFFKALISPYSTVRLRTTTPPVAHY